MSVFPWVLAGGLAAFAAALLMKICLMRRAAREIAAAFADRLAQETNTLIGISSRDGAMCALARAVNLQLAALRAQRHRYEQGDAELKDAVANLSHDLRTPLTAICGYLDLLEAEEKSETAARYLAVVAERAGMMKQLTEELFRYSVILSAREPPQPERVCVNRVLEESLVSFYAALTERGITPRLELTESPVVRMLNRTALRRVFDNILQNAVRYSDGDLCVRLQKTGEILFSNSARGLDEVQAGRLFKRFFSVENAQGSTGLGLSIAKTLTRQMNGTVTAEYRDGVLCVRLYLPETPDAAAKKPCGGRYRYPPGP